MGKNVNTLKWPMAFSCSRPFDENSYNSRVSAVSKINYISLVLINELFYSSSALIIFICIFILKLEVVL